MVSQVCRVGACCTLACLSLLNTVSCVVQFTVQPANTTVTAGQEATLNCAVSGLPEGSTFNPTWFKSGIAYPSGRDVGGLPRHSITGAPATEGNLHITGVMLSDDAPYRCNIDLFGRNGNASNVAYLTVQVPPDNPIFDTYQNGSAITIQPPQQVVLVCRANNARPAATITWLKGGAALVHDTPVVVVNEGSTEKLSSIASTLTLNPEREDNGNEYKCVVSHPAITQSLELSVSLNVQFAPGHPTITTIPAFLEGMKVKAGTQLTLRCESRGGNPLADVYWWKNGNQLDFSYITDRFMASNTINVMVDSTDDGAVYMCKASNVVLQEPLTAQINLEVVYAPAYVNITGHENMVKAGDSVTLTCTTAPSNPPATISWSGGSDVELGESVVTDAPTGGSITTKTLTLVMSGTTDQVDIICQASNRDEIISTAVTVSVMYPPDMPQISGNLEGLRSGRPLSLSCTAFRGNPLADLTWYKNGEVVVATAPTMGPTVKAGSTATRDLVFLMDKTDNGANYSCNATNAATTEPLQALVTLHVLFPPDSIEVTAEPAAAHEGNEVTVTCQTKSSNPESHVTWWQDGVAIQGGEPVIEPGEYGGFITRTQLSLPSVTSANNGAVFKCRASNDILDESTNDAITLDVRYKPQIATATGVSISSGEDFTLHTLECAATGNPETLTHTWHHNDAVLDVSSNPRLTVNEQGALLIQNMTRNEGGKFMCLVSNEEGNSNITATITVNYSPTISSSDSITVTLYSVGEIVCEADANPKPDDFITWEREGLGLSGFQREYTEGKAVLRMLNVSLADGGLYTCHANNGIGTAAEKEVQVVVQYKPQIDQTMPKKVAQTAGQTAILKCAAEGAPLVRFTWQQNGGELNMTSDRYALDTWKDVKYTNRYESRLIISHVNENFDYGPYQCKAHNDLGETIFTVNLEKTSAPESPSEPTVVGVSPDSITLSWVPGFDGGLDQSFTVRFSRKDSVQYQYVDVIPHNATSFTITSLSAGTEYEITVRGKNALGPGPFFAGIITAVTEVEPTVPSGPARGILVGDLPLYLFLLVVFLLLLSCVFINIFLCCCLIKRRRSKRDAAGKSSGVQLERRQRRGSQDSAPTETHSVDSLSQKDSDRDRGYSTDDDDYDHRRYADDYSFRDSRDYSVSDRFDDDHRPIVPHGSRVYREPEPGFYNTGYRPPSYAPSWDSYGGPPSISAMTADSRISEELDERDYVERLRRKQRQDSSSRVGALSRHRGSATPSPVPSSLGNFVQLSKGGKATASIAGSEEGFLV